MTAPAASAGNENIIKVMCSKHTNIPERTSISTDALLQTLGDDNYLEVRPGLAVCVSHSEMVKTSSELVEFEGDNEFIHLNCQLEGVFEARIKDVLLECRPGDINMGFSAGEIFYTHQPNSFCNFGLMITPEVLCELAGEELTGLNFDSKMQFFVKHAAPNKQVTQAARQIACLMKKSPGCPLLLQSAILAYLHWHLCALQDNKTCQSISYREKKQLHAAKDFLLNDLSAAPTIAELARAVGLNQCKLKKGFKSLFGTSIYALFQEQRMNRAMQLLKNNNVTETAMVLGYSNVSHFSSAFRKQFGVLPKEARRDIDPELNSINMAYY